MDAAARPARLLNSKDAKVENASVKPRRFFGLHMVDGTAEYEEDGAAPYKIFVNEKAIRAMGPSFEGCPVYVQHVETVDLKNIQTDADGFVVKSFYNAADGKHWVEFMVVSDEGHRKIAEGWKLSNAYLPVLRDQAGVWNGMDYSKEVVGGEYEHLAIVPNPRYAESVIFTPEEFKQYNDDLAIELKRVTNSTGEKKMSKLQFWKRTAVAKVENAADLEGLSVTLPKSKKEVTVADLVANMDSSMMPDHYANGDHKVKVGEEEMTVNDLVKKHMDMCAKNAEGSGEQGEDAAEDKGAEHPAEDLDNDAGETDDEEEKDPPAPPPKKNAGEKKPAKKDAEGEKHFTDLKNANRIENAEEDLHVDTSDDQVARGKNRYGSN